MSVSDFMQKDESEQNLDDKTFEVDAAALPVDLTDVKLPFNFARRQGVVFKLFEETIGDVIHT